MHASHSKIRIHVDMDSFYSSIEVKRRPELKGLPVIVGSDPKSGNGRGVVSTCSYEAREYGVHSAMPVSKAYRLCPDAVFLPVDMKHYKEVSSRIMNILKSFADAFEQVSVDEAYLDISNRVQDYETATRLAKDIKDEILIREGLTCSIGIAPSKVVAKIASDFQKPDGLTVVKPSEVKGFLAPMPVSKIPGVGKKTNQNLAQMGIKTIKQLAEYDVQALKENFGKAGIRMHQIANGIDHSQIRVHRQVKSISKEDTFDEDTSDPVKIESTVDALSEEVQKALVKKKMLFRTITIKVRFSDFTTHTRSKTLGSSNLELNVIKRISMELMQEFLGKRKIRLVGVGLSKLEKIDERQMLLTDFL